MSQYKFVLFLAISLIFFAIHRTTIKSSSVQKQQFDSLATITRINDDDYGKHWFYVDVVIDGVVYSAQTDTYSSIPADTRIGDCVSVKYRYTANEKIRCYITQEGFQRIISEQETGTRFFLYGAIASFALFLALLAKMLLWG